MKKYRKKNRKKKIKLENIFYKKRDKNKGNGYLTKKTNSTTIPIPLFHYSIHYSNCSKLQSVR